MKLPHLESPERYTGLYVFDFGDQTAVGYTADEIAVLLESEKYADGKAFRIHRALPDGTMELQGVAREKFQLEDGFLFYRGQVRDARSDFEALDLNASETPPPCRMKGQLSKIDGGQPPYLTAILFPAEFTHDISDWLDRIGFNGGDLVEGGPSRVTDYYQAQPVLIDRRQWWPARDPSRPAEEVLASTHLQVQRVPA